MLEWDSTVRSVVTSCFSVASLWSGASPSVKQWTNPAYTLSFSSVPPLVTWEDILTELTQTPGGYVYLPAHVTSARRTVT